MADLSDENPEDDYDPFGGLKYDAFLFETPGSGSVGGGGSEQLLDPAEQRLFSQFLDELVQNPNPFDSSSSASSASTSSSLPQQQPFLPHFPTSSSSGMVMPPSPTLVPASPSSSSSLPSFSSSSYSATARISANWLNPSTLPSPQGFQSLFTLPTQRPLSSSPLPSHNHNSNNLNHNSSPNGNVKGFAPQNAFPFQAPAPVAAPKTVKNNPSEGSSPTSTKPKESSDPMATLEENGYETMVFGFSGEEMQQTKVVRGAITPQALKMGMRSAVKTYERKKSKSEPQGKEAREVQVEKERKIDKKAKKEAESSSDEAELDKPSSRDLLTEDEKRLNHIASEKKRRNNIRVAFDTMTDLVPALNGTHFSKATILNKANEYIYYLKERNTALTQEVQKLSEQLQMKAESSGGLITPSKSESVSPGQVPSQGKSSNGLPDAPESRRELGTSYRFQQSDEMKILMICFCFFIACLNPPALLQSSPVTEQGTRSIMSSGEEIAQWTLLEMIWLFFRIVFGLFAFYAALTFDSTVDPNSKAFQLAVEARIAGEKASNALRESFFIKALLLLGCSLPGDYGLLLSFVWQVSRQFLHLAFRGGWFEGLVVKQRGVENQFLELARSFYLLSHYYTSADQVPLKAWVALLRALNVAESVGAENNPLLAEIYSQMSFHLRFQLPQGFLFSWLSKYYRRLSQEARARCVCSTKTHGYLALHDAWERMALGELSEAASDLLIVKNYFVRAHRIRSAWEALMFRGIALYLQGNVTECQKVTTEVTELTALIYSDQRCGSDGLDPSLATFEWWNKILLSLSLVHSQTPEHLEQLLREIALTKCNKSDVKWTENSLLQGILLKSVTACSLGRQGKVEEALTTAEEAFGMLSVPQRTLFIGVTHLATSLITTTVVECWRQVVDKEDDLAQRAALLCDRLVTLLQSFAKIIPFAAPRASLCQGISLCLKGDKEPGIQCLRNTELVAARQNMPMERALAIYYKCVFSKEPSVQDVLLSESIFTSIGADHEACQAKILLA